MRQCSFEERVNDFLYFLRLTNNEMVESFYSTLKPSFLMTTLPNVKKYCGISFLKDLSERQSAAWSLCGERIEDQTSLVVCRNVSRLRALRSQ